MDSESKSRKRGDRLTPEESKELFDSIVGGMKWSQAQRDLKVSSKTYNRYKNLVDDNKTLADLGNKPKVSGFLMHALVESARVLGAPAHNLVPFLDRFFPGMVPYVEDKGLVVAPLRPEGQTRREAVKARNAADRATAAAKKEARKKWEASHKYHGIATVIRYRQIIRETFGANYRRPAGVTEPDWKNACRSFGDVVRAWDPGTVGLHAVEVSWKRKELPEATREKMLVGIVADRGLYAERYFRVFLIGDNLDDAVVAWNAKRMLEGLQDTQCRISRIMLVRRANKESRSFTATAVENKKSFKNALGMPVTVKMDALPSFGAGTIEMPGEYASAEEAYGAIDKAIADILDATEPVETVAAPDACKVVLPVSAAMGEPVPVHAEKVFKVPFRRGATKAKDRTLLPKVSRDLHKRLRSFAYQQPGMNITMVLEYWIEKFCPEID